MPDRRLFSTPVCAILALLVLLTACTTSNRAPIANAGPNQTVAVGNTVTLNANATTDGDGDTLSFAWTFESKPTGSAAALTGADTTTPTFVADEQGAFVLTLSVTDGQASDSDNITIIATTTGAPNDAPALSSIDDQSAPRGTVIEVSFTITDEDPDSVTVEASSSDTSLVTDADLEVLGSGADRSLRIDLAQEGSGKTVITVKARDAGALETSTKFTLTVTTPFEAQLPRLTAKDAAEADGFGHVVAMSGGSAVIGAPQDDDDGVESGSAYLYARSGAAWVQTMKLPPRPLVVASAASDVAAGDRYGSSVAISGSYIMVGAPGYYLPTTYTGAAYLYERCPRVCQEPASEVGQLVASDGAAGDAFGSAVAIAGNYAMVGAPKDDDDGTDSGSVYVLRLDGDTWAELGKLTISSAGAHNRFGGSVAMHGDYAIVGASQKGGPESLTGLAYVFRRSGDTWTGMVKLTASDAAAFDFFGSSVALDTDYAIVGADQDNGPGTGAAYVFRLKDGTWREINKLTAIDGAAQDLFGVSVAIRGGNAIIGAPGNSDDGPRSGSAHVFVK